MGVKIQFSHTLLIAALQSSCPMSRAIALENTTMQVPQFDTYTSFSQLLC